MNVQEAIRITDEIIDRLHKETEYAYPNQIEHIESEIEALSIVLESAKLLHADEIDPATNAGGGIVVERFVQKEDYERLGIEVTDS